MNAHFVAIAISGLSLACGHARDDAPTIVRTPSSSATTIAEPDAGAPQPNVVEVSQEAPQTELDSATPRDNEARHHDRGTRIPPEKIQATVRASFGKFRKCYELGLRTSPNLQGRVTVKFDIGPDGQVTRAAAQKSDLPYPEVIACVLAELRKLRFPKPDGGNVTVVYPLIFNPGE